MLVAIKVCQPRGDPISASNLHTYIHAVNVIDVGLCSTEIEQFDVVSAGIYAMYLNITLH